jgi:hypothetical protein
MLFSGPKDVKDLFSVLKDSASEVSQSNTAIKHQVLLHTLLLGFLVFSFVFSEALQIWILNRNFPRIKTIKRIFCARHYASSEFYSSSSFVVYVPYGEVNFLT